MISLLVLGFLIGMRHAFEADHIAAVATLATRSRTLAEGLKHGALWGVGHTLTLLLFGSLVLVLDAAIPERVASTLELVVGVMLVGLGVDVVRRLVKERVHFHVHRHPSGERHFHAHSHLGQGDGHDLAQHDHRHHGLSRRALFVGLMHGMAGSAALILLTVHKTPSPLVGVAYILLFGLGSLVGMAALSLAIAYPLRHAALSLSWVYQGLVAAVALATIGLGVAMVVDRLAAI